MLHSAFYFDRLQLTMTAAASTALCTQSEDIVQRRVKIHLPVTVSISPSVAPGLKTLPPIVPWDPDPQPALVMWEVPSSSIVRCKSRWGQAVSNIRSPHQTGRRGDN